MLVMIVEHRRSHYEAEMAGWVNDNTPNGAGREMDV
jgi:hypothetical protein